MNDWLPFFAFSLLFISLIIMAWMESRKEPK